MNDQLRFLRQWAKAPLRTASVTPSGAALAKLMTQKISPKTVPVLELGPGTGVFTRALIARGVPEDQITMVELNPDFAANLQVEFPRATVLQQSAGDLTDQKLFTEGAGAALSGLGLLSMPIDLVETIIKGVFANLRPGGEFVQFTYGPRCPIQPEILERLNLRAYRTGHTWRNLPPASVYHVARTGE